ncbi:hypothetical protein PXK01_12360 [Phaeobacter sp. PT47_59]|uniref:hypothetical protein n=1 Tax=Phaeobacter sp. PT47_59 TaxID=3029979 RepID=UPI0023802645|nr:hypothetical protein [Phaeobacter sp. PT47_59]MDE4174950.1 hypothetical protein [Phaeobacter sp. PT47_59]
MIRKALAIAALIGAPFAVNAQEAPLWEGYWARNAAWCAKAGEVGEGTPDWYGRDGLFGLEWSCDIKAVEAVGVGNSWSLQLQCLGAGYAYSDAQIFLVTPEDRLLVIGETGVMANLVRCMKLEKTE